MTARWEREGRGEPRHDRQCQTTSPGMHHLLRERRVAVVSFEYAVYWHAAFHRPSRHALTEEERASAKDVSLHAFQSRLGEYGSDACL